MEFYFKTVEEIGARAAELRDAAKMELNQVQQKLAGLQREAKQNKSRAAEVRDEIVELQRQARLLGEKFTWLNGLVERAEQFEDKQYLVELTLREMAELGFTREDDEKGEQKTRKRTKKAG